MCYGVHNWLRWELVKIQNNALFVQIINNLKSSQQQQNNLDICNSNSRAKKTDMHKNDTLKNKHNNGRSQNRL